MFSTGTLHYPGSLVNLCFRLVASVLSYIQYM